jgi:MFS family permease
MASHAERVRQFRLLWAGQSVSVLGDGAALLAVPLLVLGMTDSIFAAGFATALNTVGYLVVGSVAGPLVDRWDVRRTLIVCDSVRALAFAILPVVARSNTVWLVLLVGVIASATAVFFDSALAVAVQDVLDPGELVAGNAKLELSNQLGTLLGPAATGATIALLGVDTCLWLNSATFVVSVLTLAPLRFGERPKGHRTSIRTALGDVARAQLVGLRFIRSERLISQIISLQVIINFVVAAETLVIVYADRQLHASATWIGVILAAAGVGGIAATVIAPWSARRVPPDRLIAWSVIGLGFTLLAMALARNTVELALANAAHGLLSVFASIHIRAVRQRVVPRELLGRVTATARTLGVAAHPLGTLVFAAIAAAAHGNARWSFLAAAGFSVCSATVAHLALLAPSARRAEEHAGTQPNSGTAARLRRVSDPAGKEDSNTPEGGTDHGGRDVGSER